MAAARCAVLAGCRTTHLLLLLLLLLVLLLLLRRRGSRPLLLQHLLLLMVLLLLLLLGHGRMLCVLCVLHVLRHAVVRWPLLLLSRQRREHLHVQLIA